MSHEGTQNCGKLVMKTSVNVATRRRVDPRNSTNNYGSRDRSTVSAEGKKVA